MVRRLFVEGGAKHNSALNTACRKGFSSMLTKAGLGKRMPRVITCYDQDNAFNELNSALVSASKNDRLFLLVDAEEKVVAATAWEHVAQRKNHQHEKPSKAEEDQLHLMAQCMESWFLADRPALNKALSARLDESALPRPEAPIEQIEKAEVFRCLNRAIQKDDKKRSYKKGEHSFRVLAQLDPARVRAASPWAERFFATLERLL